MGKKKHRLRRAREQTVAVNRAADSPAEDIGMRVGWLSFATQGANVPIYATVECWFPGTKELARIPERLTLSWEGLRYKVYLPDHVDAPLAYQDDPVPKEHHETFQRLLKHWGYWFLRLHGDAKTWDFQVFENEQVFALQHPIEESLRAFATPLSREHVIDVLAESLAGRRPADVARAAAIDTVDKFESLVGSLPVAPPPPDRPTSVRAYACKHDGSLGVFVTLDVDDLEARLQQIVGGPMFNFLWENASSGVDLAQFFSKDGRNKPEVWLRQKRGVHGQSVGSRVKLFGKRIPMEKFVPEAAESVTDDDLPTIRKIGYEVRGASQDGKSHAQDLVRDAITATAPETFSSRNLPPMFKDRDSAEGSGDSASIAAAFGQFDADAFSESFRTRLAVKLKLRGLSQAEVEAVTVAAICDLVDAAEARGKSISPQRTPAFAVSAAREALTEALTDPQAAVPKAVVPKAIVELSKVFAEKPPLNTTEIDKPTHEAIVANYIQLCQTVRLSAMAGDENSIKIWPHLRDAVIFELPVAAYTTLHSEFSRYVVRSARVNPDLPDAERTPAQEKRIKDVIDGGRLAPFPEKLPFRECFLAYGGGVNTASPWSGEGFANMQPDSRSMLYGHLVTASGLVVSFRKVAGDQDGQHKIALVFNIEHEGDEWNSGTTLSPWIVNAIIAYVNEHKTLIEAGKRSGSYERFVKRTFKGLCSDATIKPPIPPPYYVVYLKDALIKERAQTQAVLIKRHIDWQHRWKVRGHECLRFQRGLLPLDPELEQELRARKYRIFTVEHPDSETFMALAQRDVPPKATTEWIAVLRYWQKECEKGPPDKPLIESVRRTTRKWAVAVDADTPEGE